MERFKIKKRTFFLIMVIGILSISFYRILSAPRIICKIPCTTCKGGYLEQNFTQEAHALKGEKAYVFNQDKKELIFHKCYALKKRFFSNRFDRHIDLEWNKWF